MSDIETAADGTLWAYSPQTGVTLLLDYDPSDEGEDYLVTVLQTTRMDRPSLFGEVLRWDFDGAAIADIVMRLAQQKVRADKAATHGDQRTREREG